MIIQLLKIIYAELKHLFLGWWADGGHMTRSLLDENDCIDTHSWQQTEHNTEFNLCFNPCYTEKNVLSLWQHRLMPVFTKQLWQTCYVLKESGIYGCIHPISNAETICNAISQVWWWGVRWEVWGGRWGVSFYRVWKSSITRSVCSHRCLKCYMDSRSVLVPALNDNHTHTNGILWMSLVSIKKKI